MIRNSWLRVVLLASTATLLLLVACGLALADPATELSEAESRVAGAESDVVAAERDVDVARGRYAAASRRAEPLAATARRTRAEARELRAELTDQQRQARTEIAELEEERLQKEEEHDEEVARGIGSGLAGLFAAAIAFAWGRFRRSAPVAALLGMRHAQAVALCVGGGFLLIVVGAVLAEGGGLPGALGAFLFWLGFALPIVLLLGRRSLAVERGQAKPAFGRERLPGWVPRSAAALLLLLGLGGIGAAIFAEQPTAAPVSAQLRTEADALASGPGATRLEEAETEARRAARRAAGPVARQRTARAGLRRASRELRRVETALVSAEGDVRRSANRVEAVIRREEREAARAQEQAERVAEEEAVEEEESSGCEPGYSPCVPSYPPDLDCADVGGSVTVTGSDPHGLDADGDGVGCE